MLFTKEITQINFDDVVSFCKQRIPESVHLDYKKDFPTNLEKSISAFANTMGGLIIIGVGDKDSKPKLPIKGIKYQEGLRERVNNIILANIYPPVFPEIQVCHPVNNKTFVIIRVPQSNMTPHYIRHRTQIYIRTDDINHPEELAPANRIEWLMNRRKKSEELREFLYNSAHNRYKNYIKLYKKEIPFSEGTISIVPLYPTKPYKTPQDIKEISRNIVVSGYNKSFPQISNDRIIQGGIAYLPYNGRTFYTEFNQFGLIYYKVFFGDFYKSKKNNIRYKITYLIRIIELIDLLLELSSKFYNELGYWGLLEFKFSLEKSLGVWLIGLDQRLELFVALDEKNISIDDTLELYREYYVNDIRNKRIEILIELIKDISWSLGWSYITEDRIKNFLKNRKRIPDDK